MQGLLARFRRHRGILSTRCITKCSLKENRRFGGGAGLTSSSSFVEKGSIFCLLLLQDLRPPSTLLTIMILIVTLPLPPGAFYNRM